MTIELHADALDLRKLVKPGDTVFLGQGTAEPLSLSEALVASRADIGPFTLFLGVVYSDTLQPEHADFISVVSYGAFGGTQKIAKAGGLQILPCHYSQIPVMLERGELRCDVALLQLSAANAAGQLSLGLANDYMLEAARRARVVIAEINDQVPWTYGDDRLAGTRIDYLVRTSRPLIEAKAQRFGAIESRIAAHAARFIADGAVLQTGIGSVPDAILSALHGHRDLGVHTGMIGDSMVDLIESGAVTNALKPIDRGITISGLLSGSARLCRFAHQNSALRLEPITYTHHAKVLSHFDTLVTINSALEVDLTGQVNAEVTGGNYVGATGGQGDFTRAALAAPRGRSIIALPATAKSGALSRIVTRLGSVTTTLRSDVDLIITEWGAAELRGQTIPERVRRMIAIADPAFREQLERDAQPLMRHNALD